MALDGLGEEDAYSIDGAGNRKSDEEIRIRGKEEDDECHSCAGEENAADALGMNGIAERAVYGNPRERDDEDFGGRRGNRRAEMRVGGDKNEVERDVEYGTDGEKVHEKLLLVAHNEQGIEEVSEEHARQCEEEYLENDDGFEKFRAADEEDDILGKHNAADGKRHHEEEEDLERRVGDAPKALLIMKHSRGEQRQDKPHDHRREKRNVFDDLVRRTEDADGFGALHEREEDGVEFEIEEGDHDGAAERKGLAEEFLPEVEVESYGKRNKPPAPDEEYGEVEDHKEHERAHNGEESPIEKRRSDNDAGLENFANQFRNRHAVHGEVFLEDSIENGIRGREEKRRQGKGDGELEFARVGEKEENKRGGNGNNSTGDETNAEDVSHNPHFVRVFPGNLSRAHRIEPEIGQCHKEREKRQGRCVFAEALRTQIARDEAD